MATLVKTLTALEGGTIVKYAGFYYVDTSAGHGWTGNYLDIISIFKNSALKAGLVPVHICPKGQPPLTDEHFDVPEYKGELVYEREKAYLAFLRAYGGNNRACLLTDPDVVILRKVPALLDGYLARIVFRPYDEAAFNGPRIVTLSFAPVLQWTIENMRYMAPRYRRWDGDSSAFANAVYRALVVGKRIELADESLYQLRPSQNAPSTAVMYHFKGKNGKDEMLEYGRACGLC